MELRKPSTKKIVEDGGAVSALKHIGQFTGDSPEGSSVDGGFSFLSGHLLFRPNPEALQRVGAERVADRNIGSVATTCDQDPADARLIVPSIEGVPPAIEVDLEPRGKIHWTIRWRHAYVAEVSGAVTGGDVHAAAERHREVREVAADALLFRKHFERRPR